MVAAKRSPAPRAGDEVGRAAAPTPGVWRRRAVTCAIDGFIRGLSGAARLAPLARPARHGVEVLRDVPYRPTGLREHCLDIYRPADVPGPWPVVLYAHGGGFTLLSKETHWLMGLAFARQGYLVLNMSYRLAPRHPFPAAVQDAYAAYAWLAAHAAAYGGDTSRVVLAGESAGANLMLGVALACCYERPEPMAREVWELRLQPRALLSACGILQVTDPGRFRRASPTLSGFANARIHAIHVAPRSSFLSPEQLELADPLVFLERGVAPARPLPAVFATGGTLDPILDDTRRLHAALTALGATSELQLYPGGSHAFHVLVWRPLAQACWRDTFAFLRRHL